MNTLTPELKREIARRMCVKRGLDPEEQPNLSLDCKTTRLEYVLQEIDRYFLAFETLFEISQEEGL